MIGVNLLLYRDPRRDDSLALPPMSILIPARNEARGIAEAVESVLANRYPSFEVVVMDDNSEDETASIVRRIANDDERVRLETAPPLPAGWCGKQHACHALSRVARHPLLVFIDADVRLAPDALGRFAAFLDSSGADLASGVPRQITDTWLEKLVVPLIHFVLLGFLPIFAMRRFAGTGFAAGCGQLFVARREAYERVGGHARIRSSRHDGITLPRAFRERGFRTDLFDATRLATCRMYRGAREVWCGFAKNATEGMASPAAIVPWSLLLLGGQVVPFVLLAAARVAGTGGRVVPVLAAAVALAWLARLALAVRFRQSWIGVLFHPVGVAVVVAIQWYAWWNARVGKSVAWKGRVQVES
jgi:glycosyltransferase involved in cell wall biosynthesis